MYVRAESECQINFKTCSDFECKYNLDSIIKVKTRTISIKQISVFKTLICLIEKPLLVLDYILDQTFFLICLKFLC